MKDAVTIDRVNNCHQDSIRFGLDQHKTALEPLRAVPLPPASVNGTATNRFHSANMADADDIAVRTALAKLSVEEQVSRLLALLVAFPWGWLGVPAGPLARLISDQHARSGACACTPNAAYPLAPRLAVCFSGLEKRKSFGECTCEWSD
jgi:hypothetical protein